MMAIQLLLNMGRLEDAREILYASDADQPAAGGPRKAQPGYLWFYVRLAAASGDYAEADRFLADAQQEAAAPGGTPLGALLGMGLGAVLLREAPHAAGLPWQVQRFLPSLAPSDPFWPFPATDWRRLTARVLITGLFSLQQESELLLMRGWLALEAGHTAEARAHFRAALARVVPRQQWAPLLDGLGRYTRPELENLLKLGGRQASTEALARMYLSRQYLNDPPP
jgi:hypothetical protein